MSSEKVVIFKNRLRCWKHYPSQLKTLEEKLDLYYYKLSGVTGVDPSKEPIHSAPNKDAEYELRDKISALEGEIERIKKELSIIEEVVESLDDETQMMVKEIYLNGSTMEKVSRKYFLARETVRDKISRELERILP